ncbi:DsbA family protein [Paenibacillus apiarius]|uniref:DsbA family protein n=1 Tax=Paenibacillus apiarius TaxID=46240 RepID=UPI00300D1E5C
MDYDVHDMLVAKYGMSRDQAIAINENLSGKAKEIGLTFQFATLILTNTFDAHRLAKYAFNQGKVNPNAQELFRAYFTYSWNLGEAQSTDMFLNALQTAWKESQTLNLLDDAGSESE